MDSVIIDQGKQLYEKEHEIFAREQQIKLFRNENEAITNQVAIEIIAKKEAQEKADKLERKVARMKKWRWVWGGVGLAAGIIICVVL